MSKQKDNKLKYITYPGLHKIKLSLLGNFCPVLNVKLTKSNAVVDHKHITKKEIKNGNLGFGGKGLLRGVIHDQANVFIGKIEKGFIRSGCHKFEVPIWDQLRAIADYLENPPLKKDRIVHPSERPPKSKLSKIEYKRICKYWSKIFPGKRVPPKYPKSGIKTPKWAIWLSKANELHFGKSTVTRIKL